MLLRFSIFQEKLIPEPLLTAKQETFSISSIAHYHEQLPRNEQFSFNPELQSYLTGKQLLLDDLPFSIEEIYEHYENGYISFRKGILFEKKRPRCQRCGNRDPDHFASFPCSRCRETCTYCRKCLMMGRVSTCTPLCSWSCTEDKTSIQVLPVPKIANHSDSLIKATLPHGKTNQPASLTQPVSPLHMVKNQDSLIVAEPFAETVNGQDSLIVAVFPPETVNGPTSHIQVVSSSEAVEHPTSHIQVVSSFEEVDHPTSHIQMVSSSETVNAATAPVQEASPPQTGNHPASLIWSGTLSPGQQAASSRVVKAISENSDILVWAVCGAGKTEVLFEGIESALKAGKRVCIATPRTDVVLELTPRLRKVFPGIEVASLYGGSEDRHKYSQLTISTTHQLLRFYKAFDSIILDEVDAFPYSVDETLQYAVQNARKDVSSMVYLTATPNRQWQRECRTGKRAYVAIPARYHRYALPVPQLVWCGYWQKLLQKGKLPANVLKWLKERLSSDKQILLFIPKIALFEKLLPLLRELNPSIETVHAEDPERKEKVQRMRDKKLPMLVTTTILERGVTFPNLDVAVLGAEDRIFTESALVQIAGRVGRSAIYPTGDIVFFHYGKTEAMVKARNQIVLMNKEAVRKGLIDVD